VSERDFVASEVHELEFLLRHVPEGDVIERKGFEERLAEKRKELEEMKNSQERDKGMSEKYNFENWRLWECADPRDSRYGCFEILKPWPEMKHGISMVSRGALPDPEESLALGRLLHSAPDLARENAELREMLERIVKADAAVGREMLDGYTVSIHGAHYERENAIGAARGLLAGKGER